MLLLATAARPTPLQRPAGRQHPAVAAWTSHSGADGPAALWLPQAPPPWAPPPVAELRAVNRAGRAFEMSGRMGEALEVLRYIRAEQARRGLVPAGLPPRPGAGARLFWEESAGGRWSSPFNSSCSVHIRL